MDWPLVVNELGRRGLDRRRGRRAGVPVRRPGRLTSWPPGPRCCRRGLCWFSGSHSYDPRHASGSLECRRPHDLELGAASVRLPIDDTALAAGQLGERIRSTNTDQCGCRSGTPQWVCVRGDGEPGYPEARGGAPCGSGAAGACTRSTGDRPCVHPLRGRCGRGVCGPVRGCRSDRTASLSMQPCAQL
jgi:hypothetical protein